MPPPDSVFRAFGDPTRREILKLLRNGPMSSGEIAGHFATAWATISRHLGVLRDAELISAERVGNSIRYELNTAVMHQFVEGLLDFISPPG